jgi:ribonuclease T1
MEQFVRDRPESGEASRSERSALSKGAMSVDFWGYASCWAKGAGARLMTVGLRAGVALVLSASVVPQVQAFSPNSTGLPTIERTNLPPQGQQVLRQIENGESFRHSKDGSVFGNRERVLPRQTRGYYREYTVPTPGVKHRGARRIVCGGEIVRRPDACYYTEDHYTSFMLIVK